ncbi:mitochondrial 39-S ribosomal protein L47 (MRP-L47)-domain-containing protein [Mycena alexandri]|uniref:Large ribosomal subunit protein uL29m n=1 Tax=Mycena alexandri TaxID=1745969 RepID=A0AAD6TEZ5_9AGAR|nr:mitochondrial 39-S ribosomal protein L47 (MRP-L47)-domain-containing protein [Mycena alexandri]
MLSALRAGRRISAQSLRHFSATPTTLFADPATPLQVSAPANLRPSSYAPAGSGSSAPPAIAEGAEAVPRPEVNPASAAFVPPSAPQLSPDHGLYGFFRRKDGPYLRGDDQYETFSDPTIKYTGRSWEASELRLKSFKDLHTLWYVLLREANLLATQREEMRRIGLPRDRFPLHNRVNSAKVRKSMARIKAVMNERRLAYEGALALVEKERDGLADAEVLQAKINLETTEWHRQHAEQIRKGLVKRTKHRAGAKRQEREAQRDARPLKAPKPAEIKEKKPRWTKAQKVAHIQHKKRQAAAQPGAPTYKTKRRLNVA